VSHRCEIAFQFCVLALQRVGAIERTDGQLHCTGIHNASGARASGAEKSDPNGQIAQTGHLVTTSYSTALQAARMRRVIDAIDRAEFPGTIELWSDNYDVVLASFALSKPSFEQTEPGTLVLRGMPIDATPMASHRALPMLSRRQSRSAIFGEAR
jgi:hypothetical protein